MLGSGVIAGFAAAILSQPADTLLSQINKGHGPKGSVLYRLGVLAKQTGFKGLFAGLGPRMVMTAGLVSGQFLIYDAIKQGACVPKGPFSDVFADDVQISDGRPTWCGDS